MIYPHIDLELTAIEDFEELGKDNPMFARLAEICQANNNVWCEEAEKYLLETLAPQEVILFKKLGLFCYKVI